MIIFDRLIILNRYERKIWIHRRYRNDYEIISISNQLG